MNSVYKNDKNENGIRVCKDQLRDDSCKSELGKVSIKHGKPIYAIVPLSLEQALRLIPVKISTITIDTSCLQEAKIRFDFTLNIYSNTGDFVNLNF